MSVIDAGKHVYCEWPLGRNTADTVGVLDTAKRRGVRHPIGLQGQMSPAINYVKDLIADGLRRAGINREDDRLRAQLGCRDRLRLSS